MKKILIVFFIFLILIGLYLTAGKKYLHQKSTKNTQNILILSFCSVDSSLLPFFNTQISTEKYPALSEILNSSFYFTNAISSTSWLNLMFYIGRHERNEQYPENKFFFNDVYTWPTDYANIKVVRHPFQRFPQKEYLEYYIENRDFVSTEDMKKIINQASIFFNNKTDQKRKIFMTHFKLMHYPLLSAETINNPTLINSIFTMPEQEALINYTKYPNKFLNKKPFLQYMFGIENVKKIFINKNQNYELYLLSRDQIENWKKSLNYKSDLQMLKKAYEYKLTKMDQTLKTFFEYYKTIEPNTVLILTGDHGESIGKRDFLSHAFTPFDEVIKFFFSVHFPGQSKSTAIREQVSQRSIGELIQDIAKGNLSKYNFATDRTKRESDTQIYSYSCSGDFVSLRDSNKWKYIYNIRTDESQLYDLQSDPEEKLNVIDLHPDLFFKFKILAIEKLSNRTLDDFKCIN